MTAQQRAVVDDLGNIAVHGRSGLVLVVKIETATAGTYENISARNLYFEIGGKIRIELSAGVDNYSRQVILTRAQIATLSINNPYAFAIHDETPTTPSTPWSGTITTYGFNVAPTGAGSNNGTGTSWQGATVVIQPGDGPPTVEVHTIGLDGKSALQVLIDAGLLAAGSDADDMLELLRAPLLAGRLDFSRSANSALLGVI
jgi:hypothetical protein